MTTDEEKPLPYLVHELSRCMHVHATYVCDDVSTLLPGPGGVRSENLLRFLGAGMKQPLCPFSCPAGDVQERPPFHPSFYLSFFPLIEMEIAGLVRSLSLPATYETTLRTLPSAPSFIGSSEDGFGTGVI